MNNQKKLGWITALAASGMMLHLLSGDISNLAKWSDIFYPAFIAGIIEHLSAVIIAFVGGNLVPNLFKDNSNNITNEKRFEISGVK